MYWYIYLYQKWVAIWTIDILLAQSIEHTVLLSNEYGAGSIDYHTNLLFYSNTYRDWARLANTVLGFDLTSLLYVLGSMWCKAVCYSALSRSFIHTACRYQQLRSRSVNFEQRDVRKIGYFRGFSSVLFYFWIHICYWVSPTFKTFPFAFKKMLKRVF